MIHYYETKHHQVDEVDAPLPGTWIRLTDPNPDEMLQAKRFTGIDMDDLQAAVDPEEKNRVEKNDTYTMVIIDVPTVGIRHESTYYTTIPLGIFMTEDHVVTVGVKDELILEDFVYDRVRGFSTRKKMRFIYQIILQTSVAFQMALRSVDQERQGIERNLGEDTGEGELIRLHELESSLVYFTTSLDGNANVLNRLTRYEKARHFTEDEDLLDDVVIENQQAREMSDIYRNIIDSTRDLVSTLLDKRLNNVMKVLTSVTVVLAIPTLISGLYGMNLNRSGMPFAHAVWGFGIICLGILLICAVLFAILKKRHML